MRSATLLLVCTQFLAAQATVTIAGYGKWVL